MDRVQHVDTMIVALKFSLAIAKFREFISETTHVTLRNTGFSCQGRMIDGATIANVSSLTLIMFELKF